MCSEDEITTHKNAEFWERSKKLEDEKCAGEKVKAAVESVLLFEHSQRREVQPFALKES